MSRLYMAALRIRNAVLAEQKVLEKCRKAGMDVEAEGFDPYKPRNRREIRDRVRMLPRGFRVDVHGRGQWRRKFVKDGEYGRH